MLIFPQNAISGTPNIIKKKYLEYFDDVFNFFVKVTRKIQWLLHSTHVRHAKHDLVVTVSYQTVRRLDWADSSIDRAEHLSWLNLNTRVCQCL